MISSRVSGRKRRALITLDEEGHQQFWRFVKAKYCGSVYGAFSLEVQQALVHWMNEHGLAAHTNAHINPLIPRSQAKVEQILAWLRRRGYVNQFSIKDWALACSHVVGSDKRTIRKYLQVAEALGRVKHHAANIWELI